MTEQKHAEWQHELMDELHNARQAVSLARDMFQDNARQAKGFNSLKGAFMPAIRLALTRGSMQCLRYQHLLAKGYDGKVATEARNALDALQRLLQVVPV